jgi:drug/metabolite transporter (DMT)-like permease
MLYLTVLIAFLTLFQIIISNENLALSCTILVTVAFSTSNILWKKPVKLIGTALTIWIRNLLTTLFFGLLFVFSIDKHDFQTIDLALCVCISFISFFGLYFFNKAQEKGNVSVIIPIINTNGLLTTLLAVVLLGEKLSYTRTWAMILSFFGVLLICFERKNLKWNDFSFKEPGVKFAFLAVLFWGFSYTFFGFATKALGVKLFSFVLESTILMSISIRLLIFNAKDAKIRTTTIKSVLPYIFGIASCGCVGVYFSNVSFALVPVTTVEFISTIGYLFPLFFGRWFYNEEISFQKYVGIGFIILGLIIGKM